MSEVVSRKRKAKTLPRFARFPVALVQRWRRRNIDCATCKFFRKALDENNGLYPLGYCDWALRGQSVIPGAPPWANETLHQYLIVNRPSYSGNPRKGTCAAKEPSDV